MNRVCGMPKCLNVATINNNWGSFCKTCVNEAFTSGEPMVFEKGSSEHKALYSRQPHYEGVIDPITFGQDNLSNLEMNGFYKMNVIKYVARCDRKNGLEDLQKAQDYLNLLIKSYEDARPKKETSEYAPISDDERERAYKEAELCIDRFHANLGVEIKRADVLEIVEERLKDYSYEIMSCGDGTTYIAKSE